MCNELAEERITTKGGVLVTTTEFGKVLRLQGNEALRTERVCNEPAEDCTAGHGTSVRVMLYGMTSHTLFHRVDGFLATWFGGNRCFVTPTEFVKVSAAPGQGLLSAACGFRRLGRVSRV